MLQKRIFLATAAQLRQKKLSGFCYLSWQKLSWKCAHNSFVFQWMKWWICFKCYKRFKLFKSSEYVDTFLLQFWNIWVFWDTCGVIFNTSLKNLMGLALVDYLLLHCRVDVGMNLKLDENSLKFKSIFFMNEFSPKFIVWLLSANILILLSEL